MSLQHKAVAGMSYLVLLQLLTRVATFVLNTLVLRHVAPALLGMASQLQVITNVTLFLSRHATRQTYSRSENAVAFSSFSLLWAAFFPLGVLSSIAVGSVWFVTASRDELAIPNFHVSIAITLLANWIELLGEPGYLRAAASLNFRQKFFVEIGSVVALCVTLFVSVVIFNLQLLGWAFAQMAFAVVSTAGYLAASGLPSAKNWQFPAANVVKMWAAFQWQAVQQLLQQEGERFVLKATASLVNQGLYSVIVNLGSLVVRTLFMPLEEVSYAYFANERAPDQQHLVLRVLVKLLATIGAVAVAFGRPMSHFVIYILYGALSRTDAPDILRAYCVYVMLLAVNGVTEAFVRSVITPEQQYRLNVILIVVSAVYMAALYWFLNWFGTVGLVWANCLAIALRLCYSALFIRMRLKSSKEAAASVLSFLPSPFVVVVLVLFNAILEFTGDRNASNTRIFAHAGGAIVLFIISLGTVYVFDKKWLQELQNFWRQRKEKKQ